jgi:protein-arginine kinase activator protein McsA
MWGLFPPLDTVSQLVLQSVGMKCDLCGNDEASVHVTQTFGDTFQKVELCEVCAEANGVNGPKIFSLATLIKTVKKQKRPNSD